jgi:Transmembrane Fragile-X-F protein
MIETDYPQQRDHDRFENDANANHFFARAPHAVQSLVTSFLEARELKSLNESSAIFYDMSRGRKQWTRCVRQDFDMSVADLNYSPSLHPKECYMQKLQDDIDAAIAAREAAAAEEARLNRQENLKTCSYGFHFFQEFMFPCIFAPLIITFAILTVVDIENGDSLQLSSCIPIFVLLGLYTICIAMMCHARYSANKFPLEPEFYDRDDGFIKAVMNDLFRNQRKPHRISCAMLTTLGTFVMFVLLRASDVTEWSWWIVFAPLLLFFGSLCFMPYIFDGWAINNRAERYQVCLGTWLLIWGPVLAFVIMLICRLEYDSIDMAIVLIPAWIYGLVSFCAALYFAVDDSDEKPMLAWCGIAGPMVTFEVLLTVYNDYSSKPFSYAVLFIPFFIWLCVWLVFGSALSGVILDSGRRRRRNRDD